MSREGKASEGGGKGKGEGRERAREREGEREGSEESIELTLEVVVAETDVVALCGHGGRPEGEGKVAPGCQRRRRWGSPALWGEEGDGERESVCVCVFDKRTSDVMNSN